MTYFKIKIRTALNIKASSFVNYGQIAKTQCCKTEMKRLNLQLPNFDIRNILMPARIECYALRNMYLYVHHESFYQQFIVYYEKGGQI